MMPFTLYDRVSAIFRDPEALAEAANRIRDAYAQAAGQTTQLFGAESDTALKSSYVILIGVDAAARHIVLHNVGCDGLNNERYIDILECFAKWNFAFGTSYQHAVLSASLAWRSASVVHSLDRLVHKENVSPDAHSKEASEVHKAVFMAAAQFLLEALGQKARVAA